MLWVGFVCSCLVLAAPAGAVDLNDSDNGAVQSPSKDTDNTNAGTSLKQWFDRITLSGFLNAGYARTGADGAEPNGHFYAGERLFGANLFIDAQIAEGVTAHNELFFYNQAVNLKELYVQFKDPFNWDDLVSFKVGRIDIPFGDEYLWQFPVDNPMIMRSAEWPWGFSQGVEVFGRSGTLSWIASVMDGLGGPVGATGFPFDHDDNPGKALNGKLNFDPAHWLHLSASAMDSGQHATSAMFFDSVNITPVGTTFANGGASPTGMVDFTAWQLDGKIKIGKLVQLTGDYGSVHLYDIDPYSRTLTYYLGQAKVNLTPDFYVAARYSVIGTFDSQYGYQLGGDYDNATDFGFDVKTLTRYGVALGYWINPNTILKVEADNDVVDLIDPAVAAGETPGTNRYTLASEVDVKF